MDADRRAPRSGTPTDASFGADVDGSAMRSTSYC
jgi:hypothetical protein